MNGYASPSAIVSSASTGGAAPVHGRICGIAGLQEPVVVVWIETSPGEGLPVLFGQEWFRDLMARRGPENLSGRGVTCSLRIDGLGDGRTLRFDDEQGVQQ